MKLAIIGAVVLAACMPLAAQMDEPLRRDASALFGQIHASTTAATADAKLGRALYWDTRISSGALTSRHSPTIFNSMSAPMLRWLGDRKTGADQAESSLTGSLGFNSKGAALANHAGAVRPFSRG
jgi:cytochrome c peroxidase